MDALVIVLAIAALILAVAMFHRRMQRRRTERAFRNHDMSTLIDLGWRPEMSTDTHTHWVNGKRVNHILHLLLSVVTGGLWLIVWIVLALNGGEKRRTLPK